MSIRNWITKKVSKTMEVAVEQTKDKIHKTVGVHVNKKGDMLATIGKLGVVCLLGLLTAKELKIYSASKQESESSKQAVPSTICINNYINTKGEPNNDQKCYELEKK